LLNQHPNTTIQQYTDDDDDDDDDDGTIFEELVPL